MDINLALEEIDEIIRKNDYLTGIDYSKKGIIVSKNIISRCQLILKESNKGKIEVYSRIHMPNIVLELMILFFFLSFGIGAVFMEIVYYFISRKFVEEEISPLILNHPWREY